VSGGTDQLHRFNPVLSPDSFLVDETPLHDLLSMSREYAAALTFLNDRGEPQGHWNELFDRDESLVIARVLALALDHRERQFLDDWTATRRRDLARALVELARWLDAWREALSNLEGLGATRLAQRVIGPQSNPGADGMAGYLEEWLAPFLGQEPQAPAVSEPADHMRSMRAVYFTLLRAIENARMAAQAELERSLETKTHEPAAALLIALLQVFQRVRARINRFTGRRLDFYYHDVLRLAPRPAVPDSVHLVFGRDKTFAADVVVPEGQRFTAGPGPDGEMVQFEAPYPLLVTAAQVVALKTLRLSRDRAIWPERALGFATGLTAAEYAADIGPEDLLERDCAPLLGGEVPGAVAVERFATIGLAISAPILGLEQGERTVRLTLEFSFADAGLRAPRRCVVTEADQPAAELQRRVFAVSAIGHADRVGADADAFFTAVDRWIARWRRASPIATGPVDGRHRLAEARARASGFFLALEQMIVDWLGPGIRAPAAVAERRLLVQDVESATELGAFHTALGRLLARWLLWDQVRLVPLDLLRIRKASGVFTDAEHHLQPPPDQPEPDSRPGEPRMRRMHRSADFEKDPVVLLLRDKGALRPGGPDRLRARIREELFSAALKAEVSTALGWFEVIDPKPQPSDAGETPAADGCGTLTLLLRLSNEDPATTVCTPDVHGPQWPGDAPILRLTMTRRARLCPFSLFEGAVLTSVALVVGVRGLRRLTAYNQLGQLDPSKAFLPFGPLPDTASYLAVGSPEPARKTVTRYRLNLNWAALPPGGLAGYYADYGEPDLTDAAFKVKCSILRDGRWVEVGAEQSLFALDPRSREAEATHSLEVSPSGLRGYWRPTDGAALLDQNTRGGFVKIGLSAPDVGFGHQHYPVVLADAMSLRVKNRKAALPNPPYTPLLARMTLDYEARSRIVMKPPAPGEAVVEGERVLHIHPFGVKEIYPAAAERVHGVLPGFEPDGQLLIGLDADQLQGTLTLLFELREDTATESKARSQAGRVIDWAWLADDVWHPLDRNQVLSDTTRGFQRSGIVILDLPDGPTKGNRILPGDLFWLGVGSNDASDHFAGLQGVHAQALRVVRVLGATVPEAALPPRTLDARSASIPGVLSIRQPAAGFGLRAAETVRQEWTRVSERLRHKMRASTPWDYERLVLEQHPNVFMVKCLPNLAPDTGEFAPGKVLVVVAPTAPRNDPLYSTRALQLSALALDRIENFVRRHASPQADIAVRNVTYEYIQVRCKVLLKPQAQFGNVLSVINTAIVEYLSPWHDGGYQACLDWTVRSDDIEACIRAVAGVQSAGAISLIHVVEGGPDGIGIEYHYEDTAPPEDATTDRPGAGAAGLAPAIVRARYPWSLALPIPEHIIEVMLGVDDEPRRTGIADHVAGATQFATPGLQIGATFVLGRDGSERERVPS